MKAAVWIAPAMFLLSCRTVDQPPAPARPIVLPAGDLPEAARDLLTTRMQGHADQMTMLLWSALFLDDMGVAELADSIAREPRLARPSSPAEDTLNAMLPERFFVLQDELVEKARALASVASSSSLQHDAAAIGRAYGELATTCMKCHETYMGGYRSVPSATEAARLRAGPGRALTSGHESYRDHDS